MDKKILGVNKNVFYLSLVSLFNDFSNEMVYSVMPAFLTRVLGAPIWFVGFLEGFAEALNNILKIFSGRLADYLNQRKVLAVLGYSISSLTRFFLYLVNNFWQVLGLRIFDRVGKRLRDAPRDALIYLSSEKEELNKSYNFHRAFDTIGAILGPLVGFILLNYFLHLNYKLLFLIASLLGFLAILTFIFVEDKKDNYSKNKKFVFNFKIFQSNLKIYLFSFFLFSLGYFPLSLILLRIQTIDPSLKILPLFYFIFNLFFVIFAFPIGKFADRYGEKLMLTLGFIFALISFLIFSIPNNFLIFPAIILLSLSLALIDGIKMVYLGKNISQEYLATAQGTLSSLYGFGQLFGGLIGGLIWTKFNFSYAFLYGSFLIFLSLIILNFALKK
ncbi:MAG: MFS transporter [Candidatus Parcubacteria bacterium]|nr:MAG: MFS transporter [Candidatus Parcubacteria bacterium]